MPEWQDTYPVVHRALAPQYRQLPEGQAEAIVQGVLGEDFSLADAEGFFANLGRTLSGAASAIAPIAQRALPGLVSGAAGGAALGPLGMLGGAVLGGVTGALGGGAANTRAAAPPNSGLPLGAPALPAIAQLLGALGSPTVQQALAAMLMGRAGAPTVPTAGGAQVPVAGITNLLGMLANRASAEWEEMVPSIEGEAVEGVDGASPQARSAWLFEQLLPIEDVDDRADEPEEAAARGRVDESWVDELYDELEADLLTEAVIESVDDGLHVESWGQERRG